MSEIQTISPVNNTTINQKNSSNKLFGFKQSNVLVIEGDESIRRQLNSLLQNWQCNTQCFHSTEEAILILEQQAWEPRLIICDFNINDNKLDIDRTEFIQNFYACDIPIIAFIDDTELIRDLLVKNSRFTFLHKPINAAQLRFVMNKKILMHSPQ